MFPALLAADPRVPVDPTKAAEDNDGIDDATETTASITSYGASPALKIGSSTQDISVGAVASSA